MERYGAELFATLNALRLPKGALSGFSLGGLVQGIDRALAGILPAPAFAAGGLTPALAGAGAGVSGGRPFNIILDGQRFPAMADQEVAEALGRVALAHARRSVGRPLRRL